MAVCIPKEITQAIKSTFNTKDLKTLASINFEKLPQALDDIVDSMQLNTPEQKKLIRAGLEEEIVKQQRQVLKKYALEADPKLAKEVGEKTQLQRLSNTKQLLSEVSKSDNPQAIIDEVTAMLSPDDAQVVNDFINAKLAEKKQVIFDRKIESILKKHTEEITARVKDTKVKSNLDILSNRKKLYSDLGKMNVSERISYLDEILGKNFGDDGLTLKNSILERVNNIEGTKLEARANKIIEGRKQAVRMPKNILDRIDEVNDFTGLNNAKFEQIAMKKLGISLDTDSFKKIYEASENILKHVDDTGRPEVVRRTDGSLGVSEDFLKAQKEFAEMKSKLMPATFGQKISVWSKGAMLFQIPSQIKNFVQNLSTGIGEIGSRRLREAIDIDEKGNVIFSFSKNKREGGFSPLDKKVRAGILSDMENFKKYGYDSVRDRNMIEGLKYLDEVIVVPQTPAGEVLNKTFTYMGFFDQMFGSFAKRDSAMISAKKMAFRDGITKSTEGYNEIVGYYFDKIMYPTFQDTVIEQKYSMNLDQARFELAHNGAVANANIATSMQDTTLGELGKSLRRKTGAIGDFYLPFIHSTSAGIMNVLDYSGVGFIGGVTRDIFNNFKTLQKAQKVGDIKGFTDGAKKLIELSSNTKISASKGTIGVGAMALFALAPDMQYIGEYPSTEREKNLLETGQRTANSFMIGGVEYSAELLGAFKGAFEITQKVEKSGFGLGRVASVWINNFGELPVIEGGVTFFKEDFDKLKTDLEKSAPEDQLAVFGTALLALPDEALSRMIPAFITQTGNLIDTTKRKTDVTFGKTLNNLPITRFFLEEKLDMFGETRKSTTDPFFGASINKPNSDYVTIELMRLMHESYKDATPTKWMHKKVEREFSDMPKELQQKMIKDYGADLYNQYYLIMSSPEYKSIPDVDRAKALRVAETSVKNKWAKELETDETKELKEEQAKIEKEKTQWVSDILSE